MYKRQVCGTTAQHEDVIPLVRGKRPAVVFSSVRFDEFTRPMKKKFEEGAYPSIRLIYAFSEDPTLGFTIGVGDRAIRFTPSDPKPEVLIKLLSGEM